MSMELSQNKAEDLGTAFTAKKPDVAAAVPTEGQVDPNAAAPAAPPKAFGKMTDSEKGRNLAELMNSSEKMLDANGVSNHMEDLLAGVMINEGGTNTRRQKLSKYFNQMMTGKGGKDKGLLGKMDKVGLEKLKSDPAALEKFKASLGEDQQYLVDEVMSGDIDVEGLKSDDKDKKAAAEKQLLESGIDLRANQYEEYGALYDRQKGGEKLNKKDAARLKQLGNIKGSAMGYDSLDVRDKKDATMADTRGLSTDRFREIYEDSQTRFEPVHYRRFRDQYEKQTAANAKLPDDEKKPVKMETSIGDYTTNADDEKKLGQSYDLLADMTTSYGAPQVMGLYGHQGALDVNNADGTKANFDLAKLKEAGRRSNVTEEDLQIQIGMLRMKDIDMSSKSMTTGEMTSAYNGAKKKNKNWTKYNKRLTENVGTYQAAEKKVDAEAEAKEEIGSQFAD